MTDHGDLSVRVGIYKICFYCNKNINICQFCHNKPKLDSYISINVGIQSIRYTSIHS